MVNKFYNQIRKTSLKSKNDFIMQVVESLNMIPEDRIIKVNIFIEENERPKNKNVRMLPL